MHTSQLPPLLNHMPPIVRNEENIILIVVVVEVHRVLFHACVPIVPIAKAVVCCMCPNGLKYEVKLMFSGKTARGPFTDRKTVLMNYSCFSSTLEMSLD